MNNPEKDASTGFWQSPETAARTRKRYASERRFKFFGLSAIIFSLLALLTLVTTIVSTGYGGFLQSQIQLEVTFDPEILGDLSSLPKADLEQAINSADYQAMIRVALMKKFPDVTERADVMALTDLISAGGTNRLREMLRKDPKIMGQTQKIWLIASDEVDWYLKGHSSKAQAEADRRITDKSIGWIETLQKTHDVRTGFNWTFFTSGDSREPEIAGVWGATVGTFYTLLVTLSVAFPIGICAAVYLEEFAPQNRWTDLIEVNINNLAAVPSIVFGLLGLALFLNVFNLPRSAPLVGGLTLALITLPTIIISSRAAIKSVPNSIRQAGIGLGASRVQVVAHHVLPQAMPGIMTGTIIGMAHALGETAPLLMIGMVAFIVDVPGSVTDAATVLPVQIYLWADSPEQAFVEKTSAAIMVLLAFLVMMNGVAIWLRQKFERNR